MPYTPRVCSYCHEKMAENEFKCKSCGNLVTTKTVQPEQPHMIENDELILDRYSIVLLVLMTLFLPPVAMTIGGVMLFSDNTYKQDTGKLLVTGAFVVMVILTIILFAVSGTLTINI
ncbi:hypothetical protein P4H27_26350 [Paenibacillus taichungensis]|uniref:hypothetical protein n=1 Tax=Paenibacillus TaxID=44249 RepID=UPI00096F8FAA|nr:hypothetical protein [Paenibacillus taichungensis]MEC0110497.1 hypothetical protein [Paenibacillus taichungensis]MEC0197787.1 hypothetical protein [Paenibacillus taichungensis]OME81661.1 hypothetical protein BK122_13390 [Paenibacillus pabuli]